MHLKVTHEASPKHPALRCSHTIQLQSLLAIAFDSSVYKHLTHHLVASSNKWSPMILLVARWYFTMHGNSCTDTIWTIFGARSSKTLRHLLCVFNFSSNRIWQAPPPFLPLPTWMGTSGNASGSSTPIARECLKWQFNCNLFSLASSTVIVSVYQISSCRAYLPEVHSVVSMSDSLTLIWHAPMSRCRDVSAQWTCCSVERVIRWQTRCTAVAHPSITELS